MPKSIPVYDVSIGGEKLEVFPGENVEPLEEWNPGANIEAEYCQEEKDEENFGPSEVGWPNPVKR